MTGLESGSPWPKAKAFLDHEQHEQHEQALSGRIMRAARRLYRSVREVRVVRGSDFLPSADQARPSVWQWKIPPEGSIDIMAFSKPRVTRTVHGELLRIVAGAMPLKPLET